MQLRLTWATPGSDHPAAAGDGTSALKDSPRNPKMETSE